MTSSTRQSAESQLSQQAGDELARTATVMIYGTLHTPEHTWTHLNTPEHTSPTNTPFISSGLQVKPVLVLFSSELHRV